MSADQVKKVKPYPFKAELKDSHSARPGAVVLLTESGVLLEAAIGTIRPGDKVEIAFQLPVVGEIVQFSGVVVKVYSQFAGVAAGAVPPEGSPASSIQRLEVHIRGIDSMSRNRIERFLVQIGQRARS